MSDSKSNRQARQAAGADFWRRTIESGQTTAQTKQVEDSEKQSEKQPQKPRQQGM